MRRFTLNLPQGAALRAELTSTVRKPEVADLGKPVSYDVRVRYYHLLAHPPGSRPARGAPREAVEISEAEAERLFGLTDVARMPGTTLKTWLQQSRLGEYDWSLISTTTSPD